MVSGFMRVSWIFAGTIATPRGDGVDQIAPTTSVGMSRQNIEHCFRDQMKVGADGRKRLQLIVNREPI
jgi:hypothetical protein